MSIDILDIFGQPAFALSIYAGLVWGGMVLARKLDARIDEVVWDGIEDWLDLFEEGKITAPLLARKFRRSRESLRNKPSGEALETLASKMVKLAGS